MIALLHSFASGTRCKGAAQGVSPTIRSSERSACCVFDACILGRRRVPHNVNTRVLRRSTSHVFTPEEVRQILAFARAMGVDYGEFDILRDRSDGRIYVVDVNKTP